MNFKRRETYQTSVGACLSLLIIILVGSYGLIRASSFIAHEQPDFIVNTVLRDMYTDFPDPINATDSHFEFAVAFLSI